LEHDVYTAFKKIMSLKQKDMFSTNPVAVPVKRTKKLLFIFREENVSKKWMLMADQILQSSIELCIYKKDSFLTGIAS